MTDIVRSQGSPFDAIRRTDPDGTEWWSARDLMPVMGYSVWRDFANAVERAKLACGNSGADPAAHFADARKVAASGPDGIDYRLTRYAAYLVAMNGDPRKSEIAAAQTYFAVKTREAETALVPQHSLPRTYVEALRELLTTVERAEQAEARAEALEPSAAAWDHLASADGDWSVGDAAKVLSRDPAIKTGQGRLFTFLAKEGWTYRQRSDGRWRPYQRAVDNRWLMEKLETHYHPRSGELVLDAPQVRVTPKGLCELHRRLGGTSPLVLLDQQPALPGIGR